ncbi:MAG TPA: MBL fold metallo-hydrolase [Anaerolineales bacterium]|nr:MBL fold metallo-hydrolase [Anaerolineales bacterium]
MNIVNVGYDSTNYYIVEGKNEKLLVDCGWPGTLPKLMAELKRKGISIKEIQYLLVTHFHPDHAGLTQELKNQGIKLVLPDFQIEFIPPFAEFFKGKNLPYVPIVQNDNLVLKLEDSRTFLAGMGWNGEIIHTPGHSKDSVTLILDEGSAFTGDLHPSFMNIDDATTRASWDKIHQHKITRIFPGHGGSAIHY